MRLCLIICAMALAGCGRDAAVPAELLAPCPGGPAARRKPGELIRAALAGKGGDYARTESSRR